MFLSCESNRLARTANKVFSAPGLCPSFSEWYCQIMLPVGKLVGHLRVTKLYRQRHPVGVGGMSPGGGGRVLWGGALGISGYLEFIYETMKPIWNNMKPMKLRALSSTALQRGSSYFL